MPKKSTDRVKAKVWTPTMTAEIEGNLLGVIESLFGHVDTARKRQYLMRTMYQMHVRYSEIEERAAIEAAAAQAKAEA